MTRHAPFRLAAVAALCASAVVPSLSFAQSLREAVEQAVRTHPEVLAASNRRLAFDQAVAEARGGYLPRVDATLGYGRERFDTREARLLGLADDMVSDRGAGLTISQMLFDGFRVSSDVAARSARSGSAAHRVAAAAEDLGLRVVGTYLEVLRREESVAAARENLANHERIHDQIRQRADSGVGRRADLEQADSRLALARSALQLEQRALRDAEAAYQRVVGAPRGALRRPDAPGATVTGAAADASIGAAVAEHPALRAARADVAAAEQDIASARSGLYPTLALEGAYTEANNPVSALARETGVHLRMRWNLFRGGSDEAAIRRTAFQLGEARDAAASVGLQLEETLRLSVNAWRGAQERARTLAQYEASADATRKAYATQFEIGQRALLDVLNAENEHFNARTAALAERWAELGAAWRVAAAQGRLLESLQVAPPPAAVPGPDAPGALATR